MFDGTMLPWAADPSLEPVELDGPDPINEELRLFVPLTAPWTPRDGDTTPDLSPYGRAVRFVNPRAPVMSALGRAHSSVYPNEFITVGPRDLSSGSDLGLGGRTANYAMAGYVYVPSSSEKGIYFKLGGGLDGAGIGVGNANADSNGNNVIGIYGNRRWLDTATAIGTGWHHIALSINGSGYPAIYLDGRLIYSDTTGAPYGIGTAGTAYTTIANEWNTGRFATAYFQGVRFWGRPLAPHEPLRLFKDRWCGLVSPAARIYSLALRKSASGTTYNDSLTETLTLADTLANVLTAIASASASVTAADAVANTMTMPAAASDAATVADTLANALTAVASASGAVTAGDAVANALTMLASASDGATLGDGAIGGLLQLASVSDGLTLSDGLAQALTAAVVASGAVAVADALTTVLAATEAVSDAVVLADTVMAVLAMLAGVVESIAFLDSASGAIADTIGPTAVITLGSRSYTITLPRRTWEILLAQRGWDVDLPER